MTNALLVQKAGDGIGPGPSIRDRAQAELLRRFMEATSHSSRRLERLTVVLVVLTGAVLWLTYELARCA